MTPRKYALLLERVRVEREHREMCSALTTAAVVNYSMGAPEGGVDPSLYMPSSRAFRGRPQQPEESEEDEAIAAQISDFHIRAGILAAQWKMRGR